MKKLFLLFTTLGVLHASAFIDINLQMQLGNPSGATADTNNHAHYLVQRAVESLDFSDNFGLPLWASWDLTAGDVGTNGRSGSFFTDTTLPSNFYRVTDNDYIGVGAVDFNRGHLCDSEDRTDTRADNDAVFYMSNIMPQAAPNNQGVWASFEGYCRDVTSTNEVLIICGSSGFGTNKIPSGKAYIGSNTWKIAVMVRTNTGTALSRITTVTNRVISLLIPNNNDVSNNWRGYVTSAHQIELETGYKFFTALPGTIASAFRAKIDTLTNPPTPSITSFTPTSGAANTNVVIAGTNFNSTSEVKFNGSNAVFIVDSNTQISAVVPTNATTGTITVTTPGGTVTSGSSFTVTTAGTLDFAVTASHIGSFTQGDPADVLTITVTNVGSGISSGTINITNILPAGFTATTISGAGWATNLAALTATRSDSLASGSGYPAITITVSVASNALPSVTNTATVSNGGDPNPANNSSSDAITVNISAGTNFTGTLAGWDVSGQTNFGTSPLSPTTNAANITVVGLTRGSGLTTSGSGVAGGWGGTLWTNISAATAVASNRLATFSITANTGYKVSFGSVSKFDYRRSSTGPTNGVLQYQVGSGAFNDITNLSYTSTSGGSIAAIDLSGITALQNIFAGTNVMFRIVNFGATSSSGTWYIFDTAGSSAHDFAIQGTVSPNTTPLINTQPQDQTAIIGSNATFSVVAQGAATLYYQWRFNGTNLASATGTSYTRSGAQSADAGSYSVVVSNAVGTANSSNAVLAVNIPPSITTQPQSQTNFIGDDATFTVVAAGTTPLSYQWRFYGTNLASATATSYTRTNVQPGSAGSYSVVVTNIAGSITSSVVVLSVNLPPSITTPPQNLAAIIGSNATFTVVATGTAPLNYQWRFNTADISGATGTSFTRTNAQPGDAGNYLVVVTNIAGSVTSSNAVLVVNIPPSITTQPLAQTNNIGDSATFTVAAAGTMALSYQWRFNGGNISGATLSSYTKAGVQAGDAGSYSVIVTNVAGTATSSDAVLSVNIPPSITTQPQTKTIAPGQDATFTVVAAGTAPLSYQWRFNGGNISGATLSSYTKAAAQSGDAGSYSVVITNIVGSVTSADARLFLLTAQPTVIAQWNFNSAPADANTGTGTLSPSTGGGTATTDGVTTLFFGGSASDPANSGSDNSAWSTASYQSQGTGNKTAGIVLTVSTAGKQNIVVNWDQRVSGSASKYYRLQYSTNGTSFLDFSSPVAMSAINTFEAKTNSLVGVPSVDNNTNFAFRIVAEFESSATGNANSNYVTTAGAGYTTGGTVRYDMMTISAETIIPPDAEPALTKADFATPAGQFRLTITGAAGYNYAVQASTNLALGNWSSIHTNVSPFAFTDAVSLTLTQRFYRAVFLP